MQSNDNIQTKVEKVHKNCRDCDSQSKGRGTCVCGTEDRRRKKRKSRNVFKQNLDAGDFDFSWGLSALDRFYLEECMESVEGKKALDEIQGVLYGPPIKDLGDLMCVLDCMVDSDALTFAKKIAGNSMYRRLLY